MSTDVLGKLQFLEPPTVNGADVLINAGGVPQILSDITANIPAAAVVGRLFLDITLNRWYRDNGTSWDDLTPVPLIDGTTNQITVVDGTNVTPSIVSIASNPVLPGTAGFVPPTGSTAQRVNTTGAVRFNSTTSASEEFNGTFWKPQGTVLQTATGPIAASSGNVTVPLDNTLPTNTEGNQIFSVVFTPISATSRIIISFSITSSHSANSGTNILSLFAGTTNIATSAQRTATANAAFGLAIDEVYSPGSTAAITFSARLGNSAGGTCYCNQIGTTTLGGGLVSSYIIQEIQ